MSTASTRNGTFQFRVKCYTFKLRDSYREWSFRCAAQRTNNLYEGVTDFRIQQVFQQSQPSLNRKQVNMDIGFSSYHNGGPAREQDFGRLSQTIGTSILKISQNGEHGRPACIAGYGTDLFLLSDSIFHAKDGQPVGKFYGLPGTSKSAVSLKLPMSAAYGCVTVKILVGIKYSITRSSWLKTPACIFVTWLFWLTIRGQSVPGSKGSVKCKGSAFKMNLPVR